MLITLGSASFVKPFKVERRRGVAHSRLKQPFNWQFLYSGVQLAEEVKSLLLIFIKDNGCFVTFSITYKAKLTCKANTHWISVLNSRAWQLSGKEKKQLLVKIEFFFLSDSHFPLYRWFRGMDCRVLPKSRRTVNSKPICVLNTRLIKMLQLSLS